MRRIRHMDQTDYIVPIGQRLGQILALSNRSNVVLERTWSKDIDPKFQVVVHTKFNIPTFDGLQLLLKLRRNGIDCMSDLVGATILRVANGSWAKTPIFDPVFTRSGYEWTATVTQSNLGVNELSGAEVYCIRASFRRRRDKFYSEMFFNHLGCFDSIFRLQQQTNHLLTMKVDD